MAQLNFGGVIENVVTREEFPMQNVYLPHANDISVA